MYVKITGTDDHEQILDLSEEEIDHLKEDSTVRMIIKSSEEEYYAAIDQAIADEPFQNNPN